MSAVICHVGMSDTLLLTKGGSLLIEFPDKPGINLTPAQSEYSRRASPARWARDPVARAVVRANTIDPDHFELKPSEVWNR